MFSREKGRKKVRSCVGGESLGGDGRVAYVRESSDPDTLCRSGLLSSFSSITSTCLKRFISVCYTVCGGVRMHVCMYVSMHCSIHGVEL